VPTDFVLVAAGNLETMKQMHIALRSRIRGAGYEVYMEDKMPDTPENVMKIARFVAQEVTKDKKIPHFMREAVQEIINESRKRAGRRGYLTLKLRDLGGLIRVAGDIAKERKAKYVTKEHVIAAKVYAATLEQQISLRYTKDKKEYQLIQVSGARIGRVNGLAVIGDEHGSGILLPIEATVVPAMSKEHGMIYATGRLGEIAKEAITNVSALIKKYSGKSLGAFDIHIQFLQVYEQLEGDSASISVATAVISSMENIPVDQSVAMTGSLSIRGEVLPIGGVNSKVEAAKEAGIKTIIIPKANEKDILVDTKGIKIIPAEDMARVLEYALKWHGNQKKILNKIKKAVK
jgi:Lon-like ATP-dependent protease